MEVFVKPARELSVLAFEASLNTQTSPNNRTQLSRPINAGARTVLAIFENLYYIGSVRPRASLLAATLLKTTDREWRICDFSEVGKKVVANSGMSTTFRIFDRKIEALNSF